MPPTGRFFSAEQTHWFRVEDGRLAEHWATRDDLTAMLQLGVITAPGGPEITGGGRGPSLRCGRSTVARMTVPDLTPSQGLRRCTSERAPRALPSPRRRAAPHPTALRMQVLTTEHWSLLASRGLAWNESFSRAAMYLSTLSGAMVALGLVAGISALGHLFTVFALVILPGRSLRRHRDVRPHERVNYHDAMTVIGMNRIRGAYLELVPELEPYFVMGTHDDPPGVAITMAVPPNSPRGLHVLAATPFVVNVLNGVVAAAIAAIAAGGVALPRTRPESRARRGGLRRHGGSPASTRRRQHAPRAGIRSPVVSEPSNR